MKNVYSCIIIDDNPIDIKILESYLQKLPNLKLIDTFNSAVDAIPTINSDATDIIFSDIEMPEMTAIGLLNSLEKIPKVILISNHTEYSMEAFEIGVTDYIQKPVTFDRLSKSVDRAIEAINLLEKVVEETTILKDDFILLKSGRELLKFNLDDILYIEALASFTKVFTDAKTTVISESISDLHARLPQDSFLRTHKSYLVPLNKIIGVSTKNVILENHKIPLGLFYRKNIEKIWMGKTV